MRNNIIDYVRKILLDRDFIEAETPQMNMIPGGANAKHHLLFIIMSLIWIYISELS